MSSPPGESRLAELARMPADGAKIAAAEDLLLTAVAKEDTDLAFRARIALTEAYHFGGEPERALVTFARAMREVDAQPDRYGEVGERVLRRQYGWIVATMIAQPHIALDQIELALDDIEQRYGPPRDQRPLYALRRDLAGHLGDVTAATNWHARLADPGSGTGRGTDAGDCQWCAAERTALHCYTAGDAVMGDAAWEELQVPEVLAQTAAPRAGCGRQPGALLSRLLNHLDPELVPAAHERGYAAIQGSRTNLELVAPHLLLCARSASHERGLRILQQHLEWLDRPPTHLAAMEFAASAAALLRGVRLAGRGALTVRRPSGPVPVDSLHAELAELATSLAGRFDRRNGTPHQGERIRARLTQEPDLEDLRRGAPGAGQPSAGARARPAAPDAPDGPADKVEDAAPAAQSSVPLSAPVAASTAPASTAPASGAAASAASAAAAAPGASAAPGSSAASSTSSTSPSTSSTSSDAPPSWPLPSPAVEAAAQSDPGTGPAAQATAQPEGSAEEALRDEASAARERGDLRASAAAMMRLGLSLEQRDYGAAAAEAFAFAASDFAKAGDRFSAVRAHAIQASNLYAAGRREEALEVVESADEITTGFPDRERGLPPADQDEAANMQLAEEARAVLDVHAAFILGSEGRYHDASRRAQAAISGFRATHQQDDAERAAVLAAQVTLAGGSDGAGQVLRDLLTGLTPGGPAYQQVSSLLTETEQADQA